MIANGKKAVKRIYVGAKKILRIYKGTQLYYLAMTFIDHYFPETIVKWISKFEAELSKIDDDGLKSAVDFKGEGTAQVKIDAVKTQEAVGGAITGSTVIGGVGATHTIEADGTVYIDETATLTDHSSDIEPIAQHILATDKAQVEAGHAKPQEAENHILFMQRTPTATKGLTMAETDKQDMQLHITDVVSAGAGHAKPQEAETKGFFSYVKPELLAQKIVPKPQEIKVFFKNIVSFGAGHAKPQQATDNKIFFTAEKSTLEFGNALPEAVEQKMHIGNTVSAGAGHAKGSTAEGKVVEVNFAQASNDTTDVKAVSGANFSDNALLEQGQGNGIKAENGGISGTDSKVYKPKKVLEIDNAGGISGADSKIYKPDKLLKTDTLVQSGAFARLFRVVCMSATTTAKLITQPPLFHYVFLGASGGGISSGTSILDTATYGELYGWAVQYDNTLYIYQTNTAEQTGNVITVDAQEVEAWHTHTDNVLFINIASTAKQTDSELSIDTLVQLPIEEWAVQTDNVLLINGIVENTDMGVS